ncbi:MAG: AmmeMemoRadiSam system protein A [Caldisericota bacterium]|jgi:AmmeMemoRadiSam system protein A|nr:AmmeMemoRadiSam system protein A [Caldisericota bacterium]
MMSDTERRMLLRLARESIRCRLLDVRLRPPERESPGDEHLWEPRGVFVTLTIQGELRGCIGTILPVSPLIEAVIRNAQAAAFEDPRFEPLEEGELADVNIELSLLSVPLEQEFSSVAELRAALQKEKPGVILRRGLLQATFLPQVWEELPEAEGFLTALMRKGGLPYDSLERKDCHVATYTAEAFSERDYSA